jgi:hypothetical protein
MLALRLARIATRPVRRCLATTTSNHTGASIDSSLSSRVTPVPLSSGDSVDALLADFDREEKLAVHELGDEKSLGKTLKEKR